MFADIEPFFLFLHYWDTHTPYIPPAAYRDQFYDGDPCAPDHTGMERVRSQPFFPFFHQYHYRHLERDGRPVTDPEYINALYDAEIRYLDDRLANSMLLSESWIWWKTPC